MIQRLMLASVLALICMVSTAWAVKVQLTAAEIEEILAGNTISGTWNDLEYKQYHYANGIAIFVPEKGANVERIWRVNDRSNVYETYWSATGWTHYRVFRDGATYFWIDNKGNQHPFVVLEGKKVSW